MVFHFIGKSTIWTAKNLPDNLCVVNVKPWEIDLSPKQGKGKLFFAISTYIILDFSQEFLLEFQN